MVRLPVEVHQRAAAGVESAAFSQTPDVNLRKSAPWRISLFGYYRICPQRHPHETI